MVEAFYCYSKPLGPVLCKFHQYFLVGRKKQLTCVTQTPHKSTDRVRAWDYCASPPTAYPPPASKLAVPAYREHGPPFYRTPLLGPPIIFPKHAADRPMNGSSQCPTSLWSIILIKQSKISVVKSNTL